MSEHPPQLPTPDATTRIEETPPDQPQIQAAPEPAGTAVAPTGTPAGPPAGGPRQRRPFGGAWTPQQPESAKQPFLRGFGAGVGLALGAGVVGFVLLVVSIIGLGLVGSIGRGVSTDAATANGHIWGPANASNTLLALNISGAIAGDGGGTMFSTGTFGYQIADQIDAMKADDYAGLVLLMDTPGGSIYGSRAIADAVVRYQERTGKKVMAYVQSMSASGGMYAMAPADLIVSDYGTFVGSIGVIFGPFERYREVTGLTGNLLTSGVQTSGGITSEYLTAGTGKDFGNPFRDMTDQEREVYSQGMQVEYAQFVDFVAEHRGIPADTIRNDLGAFMFDPTTAIEKGLVDEVMGRADGFRRAATLNGVDPEDTKVVSPVAPMGLASLLGIQSPVPGHNIPLSTADGVRATSQICTGAPTVLAFAGDFTAVCGA